MRKTALRFGCPGECKLSIFDSKKAADKFLSNIDRGIKVMILCNRPQPLLSMLTHGFAVEHITVGNMSTKPNAKQIRKTVFVSPEEWDAFRGLAQGGVSIFDQMIPSDPREEITELFK